MDISDYENKLYKIARAINTAIIAIFYYKVFLFISLFVIITL